MLLNLQGIIDVITRKTDILISTELLLRILPGVTALRARLISLTTHFKSRESSINALLDA